jgi:hypothetical protein
MPGGSNLIWGVVGILLIVVLIIWLLTEVRV